MDKETPVVPWYAASSNPILGLELGLDRFSMGVGKVERRF